MLIINKQRKYIFFILPQNLLQSKQLHNAKYAILCVEFPQVQKVDLSEIVISVLLEVSTLYVVGQVLNANVSPE